MKTLYIDMDNVLVDFPTGIPHLDEQTKEQFVDKYDDVPGIFSKIHPVKGAIEAYETLSEHFDIFILSTAPWKNPSAWSDKLEWVHKYLPQKAYKRLILTHHKDLNKGHFLVDDREKNGAKEFEGELLLFGSQRFPDWNSIVAYLMELK